MHTAPVARPSRRWVAALLALLLSTLLVRAGAGAAHAADGYKYWNYFHVKAGRYVFAKTGPGDFVPANGSVEAYRYGLSSTAAGLAPRTAPTTYAVDDLCKGSSAEAGEKRVGVLIDYGTAADDAAKGDKPPEPRAACAVVPTKANGQQVLDAVADIRLDKQLLCGIDGYPVKSCAVTVGNPPAKAKERPVDFALPAPNPASGSAPAAQQGDGGVSWPLVGALAAVVVIGGGAFALSRRNRTA